MKVLLLTPKSSPSYLRALYSALRIQVGTCDIYALDERQSSNLEDFFRRFIRLAHYDRIVLMYDGNYIYQESRFLRTLPNVTMLRCEYDPPELRKKMKSNFHAMPWLRWIGSDADLCREYASLGYDAFWVQQVYDPEHFHLSAKSRPSACCHLYDGNDKTENALRPLLPENVELRIVDKKNVWKHLAGNIFAGDLFVFIPERHYYDPTPMIMAMACGAVVLTTDPGNDTRILYRWRNLHDVIFIHDAVSTADRIKLLLAHPGRITDISRHALERVKLFKPSAVGQRIGECLEIPVRNPADYPKRQRIFGFEI